LTLPKSIPWPLDWARRADASVLRGPRECVALLDRYLV